VKSLCKVLALVLFAVCVFGLAAQAAASDAITRPTLQLWLRADAGVVLDANGVIRWDDQSGRGNHAYGEPGAQPALVLDAVNGRPALAFDGQKSFVVVPHSDGLNAGTAFSVIAVYRYAKGSEIRRLMQKRSNVVGTGADAWYVAPGRGLAVAGVREMNTDYYGPGEFFVHTGVFDVASGKLALYKNGVLIVELPAKEGQVPNNHPLFIGKREHSNEAHFAGAIAEILIFSEALDDAARAEIERSLMAKYGL